MHGHAPIILLLAVLAGLLPGQDTVQPRPSATPVVAPSAATPGHPAAASAPVVVPVSHPLPPPAPVIAAGPVWKRWTLRNHLCAVEISDYRASIGRFSLLYLHPIPVPAWKRTGAAPDPGLPLPVLDRFNDHAGSLDMHDYVSGIGLEDNLATGPSEGPWAVVHSDTSTIEMSSQDPVSKLAYTMTYRLLPDATVVAVELTITNHGAKPQILTPTVRAINGLHQDDARQDGFYSHIVICRGPGGKLDAPAIPRPGAPALVIPAGNDIDYVGVKDRFFAALWKPGSCVVGPAPGHVTAALQKSTGDPLLKAMLAPPPGSSARCSAIAMGFPSGPANDVQGLVLATFLAPDDQAFRVAPGEVLKADWSLTVTSMIPADLARLSPSERQIEFADGYYKFFRILAQALTFCLDQIDRVVGNYGVALILLTLFLKLALFKISMKNQERMFRMQRLAPEIKAIQEQYKNDKQKAMTKQMELYKRHGLNPLGCSWTMFVQIPIFIALYQSFIHSAEMRGHGFLWINDLTTPDQIYGLTLPYLGWQVTINPLSLTYIAVSALITFMQPMPSASSDPQQQQTYKMMRWMPLVMGLFFYNMPAGLVLYFTANALFSAVEIRLVRQRLGHT